MDAEKVWGVPKVREAKWVCEVQSEVDVKRMWETKTVWWETRMVWEALTEMEVKKV